MKKTTDGIRIYIDRLQPQIRLFYRAAHAMTGSRELAECVLSNALLRAYLNRSDWRERMSFREGVMRAIWAEGREQLRRGKDADWDWTGLTQDVNDHHPLLGILAQETPEVQRAMILRYGCSLTAREIAALIGRPAEQVRDLLSRCQVRAERELKKREIPCKPFDRYAVHELRYWMNRDGSEAIDVGHFLSTFEKDAAGANQPRRIFSRIIRSLLIGIGALMLAAAVWVIAILMEM